MYGRTHNAGVLWCLIPTTRRRPPLFDLLLRLGLRLCGRQVDDLVWEDDTELETPTQGGCVPHEPVHFHGYVSDHLAARNSRIRLLPLPTYAPWTNPMEKVWLKLCREVLTQHPYGACWQELKALITRWFDKHREGSAELGP